MKTFSILILGLARQSVVDAIGAQFQKEGVAGYAEFTDDVLTVHSERCTPLRYQAVLHNKTFIDGLVQMEVKQLVYTDDKDQKFVYDVQ
jgi:hypothetical protein